MKITVRRNWRELSEAASRETDSKKLLDLVEELNQALAERENELRRPLDAGSALSSSF
jgi:hypothetical protein